MRVLGSATFAAVLTAFLGVAGSPAKADGLAAFILQPYYDEIAACEAAKPGLQAQADRRLQEMNEDLALLQRQYEFLNVKVSMLEKNWKHRINLAQNAYTAASNMATRENGDVPHFGASMEDLKEAYDNLKEEYEKVQKEISEGSYSFHSQAIGWITRQELDGQIKDLLERQKEFQDEVGRGEYEVHTGAQGWHDRNSLDRCIEQANERLNELSDEIARGDYEVDIPGYGETTRNDLLRNIEQTEQEMSDMADQYAKGDARIHRGRFGHRTWWSLNSLEGTLSGKQKAYDELEEYVATPAYKYHLPDKGWMSAESLEAAAQAAEKAFDGATEALAQQIQRVTLPDNKRWNVEEINSYLQSADSDGASEGMKEKAETLKKWVGDIATASQHDIDNYALEKSVLSAWIAEINKLKKFALEADKLDLDQWKRYRGDYNDELQGELQQKKAELARMNAALEFLP